MSMAWRICASAKCPMRHFAMTGMETAAWMPLIMAGVAHAGHAAGRADVGGDALERHNGRGAGGLGDAGLLGGGDVHDDAAFQHLGELAVEGYALGGSGGGGDGLGHEGSFLSRIIWAEG